ncbi:hypothetical protein [Tenacibaculum sp. E3R01]|uniref:hypothetical protein n=1 Tax=Tenacibaculum sp. E3R01 TaxID=2267227 RepID=UPI001314F5A3|nr:hypothetical protein [Tenacibaculum sp. E3R01]
MNKLSLEALECRVELVVTSELLNSISGGTENACHDESSTLEKPKPKNKKKPLVVIQD